MSNIYNLEPQAYGLIILKTTFGDLELELFTKQCPKNTKNFVQYCLDGYYDGSVFDRVERDFIAIGGQQDRPGAGSLELDAMPDEFHQRLRFSRRGLLATANTEKNVNGPKFFFTLGPAPELQNKHSIFGRLRGDSVYYLVDLNDCHVDDDMRPISEKKVIQVVVVDNPYPELTARSAFKEKLIKSDEEQDEPSRVDYLEPKFDIKHSKKLSFYEDSDEEENGDETVDEKPADVFKVPLAATNKDCTKPNDLKTEETSAPKQEASENSTTGEKFASDDNAREKKLREIREEIKKLKQKLENESATKIRTLSDRRRESLDRGSPSLNITQESKADSSKHSSIEEHDPAFAGQELRLATKKGRQRERETMELMQQFKKKLKDSTVTSQHAPARKTNPTDEQSISDDEAALALDLVDGDDWLHHKFDADVTSGNLAKDANTKGDDWYSIDDPRNPMVERVEKERARDYKRHKERDRHRESHHRDRSRESERSHRSDRHSSRHRHR